MLFDILPAEFSETHTNVPAISLVKLNFKSDESNFACTTELNESGKSIKGIRLKKLKESQTISVKLKPLR